MNSFCFCPFHSDLSFFSCREEICLPWSYLCAPFCWMETIFIFLQTAPLLGCLHTPSPCWADFLPLPNAPVLCALVLPDCLPFLFRFPQLSPKRLYSLLTLKIQAPLKRQSRFRYCILLFCLFNQYFSQHDITYTYTVFLNSFIEMQFLFHIINP